MRDSAGRTPPIPRRRSGWLPQEMWPGHPEDDLRHPSAREISRHLHHLFTWRHIIRIMGMLLCTMVIYAFWSFVLIQKGGMLSVAGMILFAVNVMLAYHAGRAALLAQRWFGIPHLFCGFGMIIAPIFAVGAFNLAISLVWIYCHR